MSGNIKVTLPSFLPSFPAASLFPSSHLSGSDNSSVEVNLGGKPKGVLEGVKEASAGDDIRDPVVTVGREAGAVEGGVDLDEAGELAGLLRGGMRELLLNEAKDCALISIGHLRRAKRGARKDLR